MCSRGKKPDQRRILGGFDSQLARREGVKKDGSVDRGLG